MISRNPGRGSPPGPPTSGPALDFQDRPSGLPSSPATRASQDENSLHGARAVVSDEQIVSAAQLRLDELVQRDSTVHEVRFRQICPILQTLQVVGGLPDQGDCHSVSYHRLQSGLTPPRALSPVPVLVMGLPPLG
jgi:hypothetical protein